MATVNIGAVTGPVADVTGLVESHLLTHSLTHTYEGWNFNSGNYLFTAHTK